MIQRIQSIFLLIAFILQATMLFLPLSEYTIQGGDIFLFKATGFVSQGLNPSTVHKTGMILFFLSLSLILPLVTIFLFKKRRLQMKLSLYNLVLLLGFQGYVVWYAWRVGVLFEAVTVYKFPIVFPVVSAILLYLAFRYIRKDDNLIRSLDRIR
jgi:hypothetical protein